MTDLNQLCAEIRAGSKAASETLVKMIYMAPFHAELQNALGKDDAQDVMQETCAVLFEAIAEDQIHSSVLGYAAQIAHRKKLAIFEQRARTVRKLVPIDDPERPVDIEYSPTQERDLLDQERYDRLMQALRDLPMGRDQELIIRAFLLEETPEQIQAELGLSPEAYRQAMHRAIRRLRRKFNEMAVLVSRRAA